jgi:hypothetical protein
VSEKLNEISLFKNVLITKSKTSFQMGVFFILPETNVKIINVSSFFKNVQTECYPLISTTHLAEFLGENCHNNHFGPLKALVPSSIF